MNALRDTRGAASVEATVALATSMTVFAVAIGLAVFLVEVRTRAGALDFDGDGSSSLTAPWLRPAHRHHMLPIRERSAIPSEPL